MARDNLFFKRAAELHPIYRTPATALVAQAIWTCILCLSGTYNQLLDFVIFAALLFYMLTAVGIFLLRNKRPNAERPVKAIGYPWLPGLYVALTGLLCVNLLVQPEQQKFAGLGLIIVALGVPVYYAWRKYAGQQAMR
jgi:APA family basic amino acid/polyamine antiporter